MRGVQKGELYRHYKGGLYRVAGVALRESDRGEVVVYHAEGDEYTLWARPLVEWFQAVAPGVTRYRREG